MAAAPSSSTVEARPVPIEDLDRLMEALIAIRDGNFAVKLPARKRGIVGDLERVINEITDSNHKIEDELERVARVIGQDGRMTERASIRTRATGWDRSIDAVNSLIENLARPTTEVARVISAVAEGDLSQKMALSIDGQPVKGEYLRIGTTVNEMVDQLGSFAVEVTRVAREVGTEGKLGGQAQVKGVSGTWNDLTDSVNGMASNLTSQVRSIAQVTTAVANGDLTQKITVEAEGEILELKNTVNRMVDQLGSFADEVTRVAREVGTEGKLGGQASVPGVGGTWRDLTDNVNFMATNLTGQVRNVARVVTAIADGDLRQRLTLDAKGEVAALADTINSMTATLRVFAEQVSEVAREVGTEGKLGGQAKVPGVSGTWKDLTDNVNSMASNLTSQVRDIARVTTAVAMGDLTQQITADARGEILQLKGTINTMVGQLDSFSEEVTRVAREVGTEGKLGGQAQVKGVSGTWRDLTDNVNQLADNLTGQVRNIALVTTAVANGDLSKKITVDAKGEIAELKTTVNTMVEQLRSFASEVTRVAREVGTDGELGGQAEVEGVSGTWRGLTESVNGMASNLTQQVRNIAHVATAVARGDLSQKISVDAKGEILELKTTLNIMVDQLGSFANEVTRVAREVGIKGKLGGQARVEGVEGTWRDLTDNVNQLASNLTTQVRAIGEVSTAVTEGDLTRSINVDAEGEVAELKDNLNQMIANLRSTTRRNLDQDWLNSNLARFGSQMQGKRSMKLVADLVMSEVTPLIGASHGAFFVVEDQLDSFGPRPTDTDAELVLTATYAYEQRKRLNNRLAFGDGLIGQAAVERKPIIITGAPSDYVQISSGLGEGTPTSIVVIPVLFEDRVMGVIEWASFMPLTDVQQSFLEELAELIGVALTTIASTVRTEHLLEQSQSLAEELQSQSEELQSQQDDLRGTNVELERQTESLKASEELLQTQQEELQQSNAELEEKAQQLAEQNARIEETNLEVERARRAIEDKAEQLALSSRYKSEFLANMSHELRTPLNSLLILSKLLGDNDAGNLTDKQVEFAHTINGAGNDLLELINDILDLSKVEAGKMDVEPRDVPLERIAEQITRSFEPLALDKSLAFEVKIAKAVPATVLTDEQRLHQVLKNLLSNALKFTSEGSVKLAVTRPRKGTRFHQAQLLAAGKKVVAFSVVDTGIGISKENLRLIFEAFQQADGTTSRRYGGTGLGLSISREIARLLGGEIQVVSTPGKGTTFTLYLPEIYVALEPREVAPAGDHVIGAGSDTGDATSDSSGTLVSLPVGSTGAPIAIPVPTHPVVHAPLTADEELVDANPLHDDRDSVDAGDRTLLIIEDDEAFAGILLDLAREQGFRGIVAVRGDTGWALAHRVSPDAIILDLGLPGADGWTVLDHLKRHPDTRHIPVHIMSAGEGRTEALRAGAVAFLTKPIDPADLEDALNGLRSFITTDTRRLLVVEDDDVERQSIVELIGSGDDVETVAVGTSAAALEALEAGRFDCMVLDLKLPDMTGFELLETFRNDERFATLPVIVYTGRDLTRQEETRLRKYVDTIVVKDVRSPERLLDETALFLHRVEAHLPAAKRRMLDSLHSSDDLFAGKHVLVVDDDVRNVFALTSVLEHRGMNVVYAENGREGIEVLEAADTIDIVLMDVMMPEMDGYEATRAIRENGRFRRLPIIALTAKAMKGDREKSIASGASDYITKPVDTEQLLSLMRVWLYR